LSPKLFVAYISSAICDLFRAKDRLKNRQTDKQAETFEFEGVKYDLKS